MKKFLVLLMCFVTLVPLVSGCSIFNSNKTITQVELQENIEFFVKTAIRITLHETKPSVDDLKNLQAYLVAAQELVVSGLQDLEALRELVRQMLPDDQHRVFALTIVDVIERCVRIYVDDQNEGASNHSKLVQAGLSGAIGAIDEYISLKSE